MGDGTEPPPSRRTAMKNEPESAEGSAASRRAVFDLDAVQNVRAPLLQEPAVSTVLGEVDD